MQIITGKYRARKLVSVPSENTRPTLARVKEAVFNLISNRIEDAVVLDLFAGSGAFGAECVSRGAKKVYFVDKTSEAIKVININTKNMKEDFDIVKSDYLEALNSFSKKGIKFDLVYLDPPYKSDFAMRSLEMLYKLNLLSDNATIVVEHEFQNDLQNLDKCYIIEKTRKYGIAYVDILMFSGNSL